MSPDAALGLKERYRQATEYAKPVLRTKRLTNGVVKLATSKASNGLHVDDEMGLLVYDQKTQHTKKVTSIQPAAINVITKLTLPVAVFMTVRCVTATATALENTTIAHK